MYRIVCVSVDLPCFESGFEKGCLCCCWIERLFSFFPPSQYVFKKPRNFYCLYMFLTYCVM